MDERGNPFQMMQHPYWEHAGDGHPFWRVFLLILFVLLFVAAVVFLYRLLAERRSGYSSQQLVPAPGGPSAQALDVVRMRYARGEIDRDQFLRMSADFGAPPGLATAETPAPAAQPAAAPDAPAVADEPPAPTA